MRIVAVLTFLVTSTISVFPQLNAAYAWVHGVVKTSEGEVVPGMSFYIRKDDKIEAYNSSD